MIHSALCKPHTKFWDRFWHSLNGPYNFVRSESQYDEILFKWKFGSWDYYPNRCFIDVPKQVTKKGKLTFDSPEAQPKEMTPMVRDLFQINGVASVTLAPYRVVIDKGGSFWWLDLQQPIEDVLRKHLI